MSVAEARAAVIRASVDRAWDGDQAKFEAALDRLILEVRAEMPCAGREGVRCDSPYVYVMRQEGDNRPKGAAPGDLCPSCKARSELG